MNSSADLHAVFDYEGPYQYYVRDFIAWPDGVLQVHIATQESTQVGRIEFMDQDYQIPMPKSVEVMITNLKTGATIWHTSDMGRVIWCPYGYKFSVISSGSTVLSMYLK